MTTSEIVIGERNEWLEADGLGGFASGTTGGVRTRRYHALLMAAVTPPTGRVALVNGFDAWVEVDGGSLPLTTQRYGPDVLHPDGATRIAAFTPEPWPTWRYDLANGLTIEHEVFAVPGTPTVVVTWRARGRRKRGTLRVRPFLSGRDIHALHHENPAFRFDADVESERVAWRPYDGLPGITSIANGAYTHDPSWYRNFVYAEERARGLDFVEDLGSPGVLSWDLADGDAVWVLTAQVPGEPAASIDTPIARWAALTRTKEKRRRGRFPSPLHRAGDAYVVKRGEGKTIVAGYPWFTDWGRDTFIAARGLCLATGRLGDARDILLRWAGEVSEGMLPNRFVEQGDQPEFNSVDAALWYVIAAHEYLAAHERGKKRGAVPDRKALHEAIDAILTGHERGTRHNIRMDDDGLLAAGAPGLQLTWMDAKVGDWVVTPRIGKPVEIQALWINALNIGSALSPHWGELAERARRSFGKRFWDPERRFLYDVIDVDHRPGTVDASLRPNQILAVGGLPCPVLEGDPARQVVAAVQEHLWTPLGPRSLAPGEPGYRPHYEGGVVERDGAYHQGTVWPWLAGPFIEAWVRVRGGSAAARKEARRRFVEPLLAHLRDGGIGHVSEIADADPPHTPRGCPFQAWSVGELLRAIAVLDETAGRERRTK